MVQLYILKGKALTPKDENTSDPYLVIKLGDTVIDDKKRSLKEKTNYPDFHLGYELHTTLPGPSMLSIEVWDDDGFMKPDLIGITHIDLEDRFFSDQWQKEYKDKKPIEERTLFVPKTKAP